MGIMEAIKKGFGVASKCFGLILVLITFNLIANLISIPLARTAAPGATAPAPSPGAIIFSIVFILLSIFIQGGSLGLIRDAVKSGSSKLASMLSYGGKYYLRLLGMGLIIILVIAIAGILAALLIAATTPLNNNVVTAVAAIVAIVIGALALYFILLMMLSPYALVCDELGMIQALKKSMNTVKRAIWKTVLLLIVVILISLGIGFLLGILTGIITAAMPAVAGQIVIAIVNSIFNGYLGIVMMAVFMAFYLSIVDKTAGEKVF
jgi:hypothetical protein